MVVRTVTSVVAAVVATVTGVGAQEQTGAAWRDYALEARIWLDRGSEPVLEQGDRVRVYYRVSEDANVAIFHIDTDGTVRLVFPRSPRENHIVLGGRDYRVLFPETSYWFVDDYPGMGYFFVVASPEPLDLSQFTYSYYDGGWDLSRVGRQVYSDPYEAIDDYVAALIPAWETAAYGLDFATYHVGDAPHDYPRFLCYDCHGFQPYYAWNPYYYACTSFRVVVYDDPYFYPSYRYGGGVVVRPPIRHQPRFVFKERAAGEPGSALRTSRADMPIPSARSRRPGTGVAGTRALPTEGGGGRVTGKEAADGTRPDGPIVVPWPGRTPRSVPPSVEADPTRATPTGTRALPSGGRGLRDASDEATRTPASSTRPVLERRRRPDSAGSAIERGRSGGSTGAARPGRPSERTGPARAAPPSRREGNARPATPSRRGGKARPAASSRRGGGSARPAASSRRGGGSARPAASSRRGGGSARPTAPSRRDATARPASRPSGSPPPARAAPSAASSRGTPSRSSRRRGGPDT